MHRPFDERGSTVVQGDTMHEPPRDLGAVASESGTAPGLSDAADDTVLSIRVSHGSLEEADYAVMVGTVEDENLSGAEHFLDRQLGGVLTASFEAGSYPGSLDGPALFVRPHPDVNLRSSPPGTYIIGLGRSVELTRSRLRRAVARALTDRGLSLENYPAEEHTTGVRAVGVSSTLLGVRDGDGLSVSESVAGIVEGVFDANRSLARFEAARQQAGAAVDHPVRITELELIERYGDRADLAAMVVRRLPNTVQLGARYVETLADVVVSRKRGGLPAGSALVDSSRKWRRFSITSTTDAGPGLADDVRASDDPATLTFDVSFLGGEARADRAVHRLDRVLVDALTARLSTETGDHASAATLYDLLVPEQMRHRFQSAPSVQLIVDETSANYPWELLSAPTPAGRTALATQGAVIRQFSETSARRLVVERATRRTALVLGAGNIPGSTPLPGALREARSVRDLLTRRFAAARLTHLDDGGGELPTVDLVNALNGDHQIVHIASHGEHVAGDASATGALLNGEFRLRAETVRQLRHVPDVVFLNCCKLGRVGTTRLAAGLAREFMAIGARAVIAAGWPVGDDAAEVFATTFYRHFLDGMSFATAVAAARGAAFSSGGRETWAAYQCYGDPELVLAGSGSRSIEDEGEPASIEDLARRVEGLAVRASDLVRPGSGYLDRRRGQLLRQLDRYVSWAESHGVIASQGRSSDEQRAASGLQRQLARVAAELGDFRTAADRYRSLVGTPGDGATTSSWELGRRWATVEDLQQASNCLSRAARRDLRAGDTDRRRGELLAELRDAVELARTAVQLLGEPESYTILGGALKRLATAEPGQRDTLVRQAADAYEQRSADPDGSASAPTGHEAPYRHETAVQLALVLDPRSLPHSATDPDERAAAARPSLHVRIDSRSPPHVEYWSVAAAGDRQLSRLLARRDGDEPADVARSMVMEYERAFGSRATWRQRASAIDHLRDLHDLLDDGDDRRGLLHDACTALQRWEHEHVDGAPPPRARVSE